MKSSPLKRRKGLSRSKGLRRSRHPKRRRWFRALPDDVKATVEARFVWDTEVSSRPCRMCGTTSRLTGHHVIPKQALLSRGLDRFLWDSRNSLTLCIDCHANHEVWARRVPWSALRKANRAFASELGLEWLLELLYPTVTGTVEEGAA